MQIGLVGLGKMGLNMLKRLQRGGHQVVAFDIDATVRAKAEAEGAQTVDSLSGFKAKLSKRRVVWVMVPAGEITESTVKTLSANLDSGDIIIDGGNSNYKESIRRCQELSTHGISYLDSGTSGGVWGLENGYCLMIGGSADAFSYAEPIFKTLAPEEGYLRTGDSGSGHFTKMIHNGIEYALMQSYAEGFNILNAKKEYDLDLQKIAALWNRGSVVRSWLLELLDNALQKDGDLAGIRGYVEDSGEGRWTVMTAIEESVSAPTIAMSLFERFSSRQDDSFGNKILAALRNEFGGHATKTK
jgi:6-phosphogluconate dehydrogenase